VVELLQKAFTWDDPPRAKVRRARARVTIHLTCLRCDRGYFGSMPLAVPRCPDCGHRSLVRCCVWDMATSARPPCWSADDERG
jgi:DNA-directed RNA polymerase subunit RPC12/RpoP